MLHRIEGVGLPNVYLKSGFTVEGSGDEQTVAYFNLDGLYVAIAHAVALRAAPLTASEFRMLRKRLGMSQEQAGAMVGKSSQAVAKWEKEKGPVPIADGKIMRLAWLSKYARRDLPRAVDQMARAGDYLAGDYVFAFDGKKWADDAPQSVFGPLVQHALVETVAVIDRARATSSAYTSSTSARVRLLPMGGLRSEREETT